MSNDIIKVLNDTQNRISSTELKETPGNIPNFTSFYDLGFWTPTFAGSTIAGTFTYDALTFGRWTRIGNTIFLFGRLRITAITVAPTGNLSIGGLPFVSANGGQNTMGGIDVGGYQGITLTGTRTQLAGIVVDAVSIINLFESGSNQAVATVQGTGLVLVGGIADIRFKGQYRV